MALTQVQRIFLHILVGTVKSLLENDTALKNLKEIYRFLIAKHKFWTFLTQISGNHEISSENW